MCLWCTRECSSRSRMVTSGADNFRARARSPCAAKEVDGENTHGRHGGALRDRARPISSRYLHSCRPRWYFTVSLSFSWLLLVFSGDREEPLSRCSLDRAGETGDSHRGVARAREVKILPRELDLARFRPDRRARRRLSLDERAECRRERRRHHCPLSAPTSMLISNTNTPR